VYLHRLEDTRIGELLEHRLKLELGGRARGIGLDAPDEVRAGALDQLDQAGKLLGKHRAHRRLAALTAAGGAALATDRKEGGHHWGGGGLECRNEVGRDVVN
jgi:hypothetical protein